MGSLSACFTSALTSLALIFLPGSSQAPVGARTWSPGPRDGFLTALGPNIGMLIRAAAAAPPSAGLCDLTPGGVRVELAARLVVQQRTT